MYHRVFIYSSPEGHLSCFQIVAIVNSAAINIEIHFCVSMFQDPGSIFPEEELLNQKGLPFIGYSTLFSTVAAPEIYYF